MHLTKADGTKGGRTRDIQIRTEAQREALKETLNFMREQNLKSLAPTDTIKEQYKYAENIKAEFNKLHDSKRDYHGERHHFAQSLYNSLVREGLTEQKAKIVVSQMLGHSRREVIKTYGVTK